ncbi:cytochrome c biogenesis protein CcdA [Alicyclobacillus sp. TC]|uniref:cytochrome c biogenesis protein CcdA n=1 Tax=Alicyclobacillus sp. TC TaxID=2606450 RepID=UPI001EE3BAFA|nr:cytochrome c biogenesis protein CcdA [Alicyclobacillus sp. TC]
MMLAGRGFELNTAKYTGGLGKRIKVGSAWSLFTYGIFFAIASIGCTFPVFLMLVSQSIMFGKFEQGLSHFVLYALGMGLVVVTISVLALISKTYLVKRLRQILPWVTRISAIMMISAGLYVIYDWLFGHHLI